MWLSKDFQKSLRGLKTKKTIPDYLNAKTITIRLCYICRYSFFTCKFSIQKQIQYKTLWLSKDFQKSLRVLKTKKTIPDYLNAKTITIRLCYICRYSFLTCKFSIQKQIQYKTLWLSKDFQKSLRGLKTKKTIPDYLNAKTITIRLCYICRYSFLTCKFSIQKQIQYKTLWLSKDFQKSLRGLKTKKTIPDYLNAKTITIRLCYICRYSFLTCKFSIQKQIQYKTLWLSKDFQKSLRVLKTKKTIPDYLNAKTITIRLCYICRYSFLTCKFSIQKQIQYKTLWLSKDFQKSLRGLKTKKTIPDYLNAKTITIRLCYIRRYSFLTCKFSIQKQIQYKTLWLSKDFQKSLRVLKTKKTIPDYLNAKTITIRLYYICVIQNCMTHLINGKASLTQRHQFKNYKFSLKILG